MCCTLVLRKSKINVQLFSIVKKLSLFLITLHATKSCLDIGPPSHSIMSLKLVYVPLVSSANHASLMRDQFDRLKTSVNRTLHTEKLIKILTQGRCRNIRSNIDVIPQRLTPDAVHIFNFFRWETSKRVIVVEREGRGGWPEPRQKISVRNPQAQGILYSRKVCISSLFHIDAQFN